MTWAHLRSPFPLEMIFHAELLAAPHHLQVLTLTAAYVYFLGLRSVLCLSLSSTSKELSRLRTCALSLFVCLLFWPRHSACGTLILRPGIKTTPPALEVWSLNHWTAREVPTQYIYDSTSFLLLSLQTEPLKITFIWSNFSKPQVQYGTAGFSAHSTMRLKSHVG